jgi:hypothetical protein
VKNLHALLLEQTADIQEVVERSERPESTGESP